LADGIAVPRLGERETLREGRSRFEPLQDRVLPFAGLVVRLGDDVERERRREEVERLRRDLARREHLQDHLAEIDEAAAVAADVEDETIWRKGRENSAELGHDAGNVLGFGSK